MPDVPESDVAGHDRSFISQLNDLVVQQGSPVVMFDAPPQLNLAAARARALHMPLAEELEPLDLHLWLAVLAPDLPPGTTFESAAAHFGLRPQNADAYLETLLQLARRLGDRYPIVGNSTAEDLKEQQRIWASNLRRTRGWINWPLDGRWPVGLRPGSWLSDWWFSLSRGQQGLRVGFVLSVLLLWPLLGVVVHHELHSWRAIVHVVILLMVSGVVLVLSPPEKSLSVQREEERLEAREWELEKLLASHGRVTGVRGWLMRVGRKVPGGHVVPSPVRRVLLSSAVVAWWTGKVIIVSVAWLILLFGSLFGIVLLVAGLATLYSWLLGYGR